MFRKHFEMDSILNRQNLNIPIRIFGQGN